MLMYICKKVRLIPPLSVCNRCNSCRLVMFPQYLDKFGIKFVFWTPLRQTNKWTLDFIVQIGVYFIQQGKRVF